MTCIMCTVCGQEKSRIDFRYNTRTGYRDICKECERTWLRCAKCKEVKIHDEFPPDKNLATGRNSWCHACHSLKNRTKWQEDPQYRLKHSLYARTEKVRASQREYKAQPEVRQRDRISHRSTVNALLQNDPLYRLKIHARSRVRYALKTGLLVRPNCCDLCGKECVPEAHHHRGYWPKSVWLDVVWLCTDCHGKTRYADVSWHPDLLKLSAEYGIMVDDFLRTVLETFPEDQLSDVIAALKDSDHTDDSKFVAGDLLDWVGPQGGSVYLDKPIYQLS